MSPQTILIFDSDLSFIELLEVIFEDSQYKIVSSNSSQNTIQQIDFYRSFVVIIDTWMSGNNAMNITNHIRQDLYFNTIPVVLMGTHFNLAELKTKSGADDFIVQPFDIIELEEKMSTYSINLTDFVL